MNYLLDTAVWANSVTVPEVLPGRIRGLLGNPLEVKGLSSVSLLECAIHHRRGRLEFQGGLRDFFNAGLGRDIELVELTPRLPWPRTTFRPAFLAIRSIGRLRPPRAY